MSPSLSDSDLPDVTLEDSERDRLRLFFLDRAEQINAYNALVSEVETLKAKEGVRTSEVNKLKERADGERIRLNLRRPKF